MDFLIEPWTYPFMRWALLCCIVLGAVHAYLGFHVVRRGVLFVDLATAQMAALGSAVGVVFGIEHDTLVGHALSFVFALSGAVLFALVNSRRVSKEATIAVFYGVASAATFVVLEYSPHGMEEVKHLLLGQLLTVDPSRIGWTVLFYGLISLAYVKLHGRMVVSSDGGHGGRFADLLFFATFSFVVTISVSLVGVLLVFCLLVLPSVAAVLLSRSTRGQLVWGWTTSLLGSVLGLHIAFYMDTPAGATICLMLGLVLLIASQFRRGSIAESG